MNITYLNAKIVDPRSPHHGQRVDVQVRSGRIVAIGKKLARKGKQLESADLHLSPGWIDMKVDFRDPGHEQAEDISSGAKAARAGGFTSVVTMPSTTPVVDNKGAVEYQINRAAQHGLRIYPAGALSRGSAGAGLSEMYDMHLAGARLFTDDMIGVADTGLMKKALLYVKNFGGVVSALPLDPEMAPEAQIHEGAVSTSLGLKGHPSMSETLRLQRDIDLLRYTDSRLHVSGLSTAEGVKLVKKAKNEGLRITAEVHLAHLIWTDEQLKTYDTNYKLLPPLRGRSDRKALIKGVREGVIDCISSDHRPRDVEHKKVEFGLADYGASMLEAFYSLYTTHLADEIPLDAFVERLTVGPAEVLGFESATIQEGRRAILTAFDPSLTYTYAPTHSRAYNDPTRGNELSGRTL